MTAGEIKIEAPGLRIDPEAALDPERMRGLFGSGRRVEIEVGIGKGRFLLASAEARPDVLHIGVEWANKYLRIAESRAVRRGLTNVRFARVDAREMVELAVPDETISAFYVFYPDPWPKKRHHKRRFFRKQTLDHVARTLVPGGMIHAATDHSDYWEAIAEVFATHEAFDRCPGFGGQDFPLPVDEPLTNFETKYLVEGRRRFRASWKRRRG